ncbi:Crp/Fnr family transcriptional regulator [Desulfoferrobacter suflitae]|uniref:Crp/Fnr family transcriptional regulator n=1 Tax=Desulfoferrobacter suflitae TaxID=2865782 RepID=UPI00216413D8|nr:Crp/Fnr family transcriptional regulator [Desulfoferrobacter suflitae]MCK8600434.1 Crp/Fnr family transcriptional regulator [Desulfoferrobacter suflitae]
MSLAEQIAKVALFEGLPETQLEEVASIVLTQQFKRGETIFLEGAQADGFYVTVSGRVKIYKLSLEGKEQILHIFGPGECFAEVPVFSGGSFPAHAEALDDAAVLFFPRNSFVELIQQEPSLAMNMLAVLSRRLRQFTHLIEDLSLKEVPGRLAVYLLYLSEQQGKSDAFNLNITKGQLASLLGTIPETLSRILGKMNQMQLIEVQGPKITIVDREALEDLAAGEKLVG